MLALHLQTCIQNTHTHTTHTRIFHIFSSFWLLHWGALLGKHGSTFLTSWYLVNNTGLLKVTAEINCYSVTLTEPMAANQYTKVYCSRTALLKVRPRGPQSFLTPCQVVCTVKTTLITPMRQCLPFLFLPSHTHVLRDCRTLQLSERRSRWEGLAVFCDTRHWRGLQKCQQCHSSH